MKRLVARLFVIFLAGGVAYAYWIYRDLRTPVYHNRGGQYIDIPRGSSPSAVLKRLASEGIVRHEWPLQIYLKFTGFGPRFKAGEYRFPSPITPLAVIKKLQQGEDRLVRLTVIEGWTRWDIANAMCRVPELGLSDPQSALTLMDDVSLISDIDPRATNLEGYLFPDTYEFAPGTTPASLIEMMVKRFLVAWSQDWTAKAEALKMTPREIVTTASLIETEAKLESERPIIASVIYNRLHREMALGVDSTVIYASKLAGKWRNDGKVYKSDVERVSPYNTRLHIGLPPGPIASPSASSLLAALDPATTDYLYYVREPSRNDGAHNFYTSEKDFNQGVQALRNWERERDIENAKQKNEASK